MRNIITRRSLLIASFAALLVTSVKTLEVSPAAASELPAATLPAKSGLDSASEQKLVEVHPALAAVIRKAAQDGAVRFRILEGARSLDRQRRLLKQKATTTLKSRHIPGQDGWAKAVDLVVLVDGKVTWEWSHYAALSVQMKSAAKSLGVAVEWGGDWKSFKDGPHFQLSAKIYP
jgi:hypothetical protein